MEHFQLLHTNEVWITDDASAVHRVQVLWAEQRGLHKPESTCEARPCVFLTCAVAAGQLLVLHTVLKTQCHLPMRKLLISPSSSGEKNLQECLFFTYWVSLNLRKRKHNKTSNNFIRKIISLLPAPMHFTCHRKGIQCEVRTLNLKQHRHIAIRGQQRIQSCGQ